MTKKAKKSKILPAVTDITLDDCELQCDKVPGVQDWFENHFHHLTGEIEDFDFTLGTCFEVWKGPPGGGNSMVENGVKNHIWFFMLPKKFRGKMMDNDYIYGDVSPWQFLKGDELEVIRKDDRVIWKAAGREFVARPPYFEIHGSHKGIELDLAIHSICPGFWYLGSFKDIAKNMSAGVDIFTQAEGSITFDGKKHEISHAGGLFEHVSLPGWDQVEIVARSRYLWMVGWSEDIQIYVFYSPGLNNYTGHVMVDGKLFNYHGAQQVSVDERGSWLDPRSSMLTACKWQTRLTSEEAELDVVVDSSGRAFSVSTFANGHCGRYQLFSMMNGSFTIADGKTIPIENMRMHIERCITFNIIS